MANLFWSGLLMVLLLSGCGWNGTPTRHNDISPPTSIEITADSGAIAANTSIKLTVKGNYSGAYTLDITDQAVWSSDTPAVAYFSNAASPNQVFARAPGTATLTATVRGVSAAFTLTVSEATITSLTVTPATSTIAKGLNTQFTVSGTFSDSTSQDLTYDAVWASSAPDVATVSNDAGSKGRAQSLAAGAATISATFGGVSSSTVLTVTAPVPQSVAITPVSANLTVGGNKNFVANATFSDGTTKDVTADSDWTSSSTAIATVGNSAADKGIVTAVAVGSATISAKYADLTAAAATVTVAAKVLESLALNAVTYTFGSFADVAIFTVTANYKDGTKEDVTSKAVWSIDNPGVAGLDPSKPGQVKPVTSGSTFLRVTYQGMTQTATIIVP